jgi:hypothetical protein
MVGHSLDPCSHLFLITTFDTHREFIPQISLQGDSDDTTRILQEGAVRGDIVQRAVTVPAHGSLFVGRWIGVEGIACRVERRRVEEKTITRKITLG